MVLVALVIGASVVLATAASEAGEAALLFVVVNDENLLFPR
jgi:hypothetical protein